MKIYINNNQMGVITKNCKAKSLLPGARHIAPWKNLIIVNDKLSYEESAFLFDNYSCSKKLVDNTETLVVKEGEFAIRFVDDVYTGSYKPGTYHFLKSSSAKVVKTFDKNVLLIKDLPNRIATDLIKKEIATRAIVGPNEKGALPTNVWEISIVRQRESTPLTKLSVQKPLEICDKIIKLGSNEGDLVYIPFAGSGSEVESCIRNNRNYIATELNDDYIKNIIIPRIKSID